MFGHTYYHSIIRKYIIMFGTMFNDIDVQRFNTAGERIQTLRIPIAYGPKEKFLVRLSQDPNFDKDVAISLPRMSFEITSMNYNSTRKLPSSTKNVFVYSDKDQLKFQYTPVPFDINIALSIFVNDPKPIWMIEITITEHWPRGVKINPNLLSTFQLFWDHGYVAKTANKENRLVTKTEIESIVNTGFDTLNTHNFLFSQ